MAKTFASELVQLGGPTASLLRSGVADPRAGAGVGATDPFGTLYLRIGATGDLVDVFVKTGAGANDWVPALSTGYNGFFGDGSDGDLNVAGATNEASTTSGDVFYDDLSIGAAGVYRPQGRRIFVRGTLTIAAGGFFTMTGNNAAAGLAGAATTAYLTNAGTAGGNGAAAGGAAGTNSASTTIPNGINTCLGGAGGAGTGGAGGAAGTIAANTVNGSVRDPAHGMNNFSTGATQAGFNGGSGGGGGGGDGALLGGGGGGGAGAIILMAREIICDGAITAIGGNGAAGAAVDCGGGGGGGGGKILIMTRSIRGAGTPLGQPAVRGGLAGASGGGAGVAGTAGADGFVLVMPI
jgi:hypothetical protein